MNPFSLFRKKKPLPPFIALDTGIVTSGFLSKHGIEIRHLVNDKWVAWIITTETKTSLAINGAIDRTGQYVWDLPGHIFRYSWCDNREYALLAAVQYLAARGVEMRISPLEVLRCVSRR